MIPDLSPGQRLMIEDGLPIEFIRTTQRQQEIEMARTAGPKEQQVAQLRLNRATTQKVDSPLQTQETTTMKTKTPKKTAAKPTKKAATPKKAKAAKKAATPRTAKTKPTELTPALKTLGLVDTPPKAPAKPKPAKAEKPAPAGGRPDGLREGSKQAQMLDLVLRVEGATEQDICKELGWKKCRVTLKRVCEKVGAELTTRKNVAGATAFFATMKKAA